MSDVYIYLLEMDNHRVCLDLPRGVFNPIPPDCFCDLHTVNEDECNPVSCQSNYCEMRTAFAAIHVNTNLSCQLAEMMGAAPLKGLFHVSWAAPQ